MLTQFCMRKMGLASKTYLMYDFSPWGVECIFDQYCGGLEIYELPGEKKLNTLGNKNMYTFFICEKYRLFHNSLSLLWVFQMNILELWIMKQAVNISCIICFTYFDPHPLSSKRFSQQAPVLLLY